MLKIKCVIIDDEPLARKGLMEYVAEVDFLELAGEFEHPLKAMSRLNVGDIQLLFLDIHMPKLSGIELFKALPDPPPVIFTTAFPQFALEGFELNALDYLVKPISFERFLKAVLKSREYYEVRQKNAAEGRPEDVKDYFFIKADSKLVKIRFDEILFVEALQNYVTIHTTDKKFITYLTFKAVEDYLPKDNFIKCHKSYIVAISKIKSIEGNTITIGSHQVTVSRNCKDEVMERLMKGKILKR